MPVNVPDVAELKRKGRKERLDVLTRQYLAAWDQLNTTIDRAIQVTLEAQISSLEAQMEAVRAELITLDRSDTANPARRQRAWKQFYPELDFEEPWRRFRDIYDGYLKERCGGGLLLLLPDRNNMCADLLLRRMATWLQEQVGYGKVTHYPFEILDHNELTNVQFLQRLGSRFDHPLPGGGTLSAADGRMREHTEQLVHKMLDALDPSHVLLLEVTAGHGLYEAAEFVDWLVGDFWQPLKQTLHKLATEHQHPFIKCIMVVSALEPWPGVVPQQAHYCFAADVDAVDLDRIVCLPLSRWETDDIERWLYAHSGMDDGTLSADAMHEKARSLYLNGDSGVPAHILRGLDDLLEQLGQ